MENNYKVAAVLDGKEYLIAAKKFFQKGSHEMVELNHILYEKYKEDYIKQRSSEENYSWNIFINRIKKMN